MDEQLKEYQNQMNSYSIMYGELFAKGLYKSGIIKDITPEQLQKYFSNPEFYQDVIDDITNYFYIINAEIHQMFELIEASPRLDFTIETFVKDENTQKNILLLKRHLHKIDHKRLTRDLLKQNTSYGNAVGIWLGTKNNIYPFVFNDCKYIKNAFRTVGGKWQVALDMSFFGDMSELERELMLKQFSPFITELDYKKYQKNELQVIALPLERTFALGTGKLKRNHFTGVGWNTPIMLDILHKRKLKDVEQTVANKIINAVAVLTLGSFDGKEGSSGDNLKRDYNNIPDKLIKSIHQNVKNALANGDTEGISLVSIPNFAKLEFPDIDSDALEADKFKQINSDILSGMGISGVALNGEGSNYNSAKLNYEIFFSRLAVLLEEIESEVYQRLFDLILPSKQIANFYMVYSKERPIELKEKLNHLKGLFDKGISARTYIEALGYDFNTIWEQTLTEINELKLSEVLQPPKTSYTTSGNEDDRGGRPTVEDNDTDSENTIRNRDSQG